MSKPIPVTQSATRVVRGNIGKILPFSTDCQTVTHGTQRASNVIHPKPPDGEISRNSDSGGRKRTTDVKQNTGANDATGNSDKKCASHTSLPFVRVQGISTAEIIGLRFLESTQAYLAKSESQGTAVKIGSANHA